MSHRRTTGDHRAILHRVCHDDVGDQNSTRESPPTEGSSNGQGSVDWPQCGGQRRGRLDATREPYVCAGPVATPGSSGFATAPKTVRAPVYRLPAARAECPATTMTFLTGPLQVVAFTLGESCLRRDCGLTFLLACCGPRRYQLRSGPRRRRGGRPSRVPVANVGPNSPLRERELACLGDERTAEIQVSVSCLGFE